MSSAFRWTCAALLLLTLAAPAPAAGKADPKRLAGFDKYMEQILRDWNVPGIAVGVVVGDQVVLAKGYGYRDYEKRLPVTAATLFQIASNTKLFTAVAAGLLVEEGKLDWDVPVRTFAADIKFYDAQLDHTVTLRDMLAHRTGISRHDLIWYKSDFTRRELYDRLRYRAEPAAAPGLPLQQHDVRRGRTGHREPLRPELGGLRPRAHLRAPGDAQHGVHDRRDGGRGGPRRALHRAALSLN